MFGDVGGCEGKGVEDDEASGRVEGGGGWYAKRAGSPPSEGIKPQDTNNNFIVRLQ